MKTITKEELKKMFDENQDFYLADVLSNESYQNKHIKGAINVSIKDGDFSENAKSAFTKEQKIVVYCSNFQCSASTRAAKQLVEMGYKNVYEYEGGLKDWEDAGFEMAQ